MTTATLSPVRWRRRCVTAVLIVLVCGLLSTIPGTARHVRACFAALADVHWMFPLSLGVLSASHYVLAAVTLRAVAGLRLPAGETLMVQFTAAAANRITPGGLGAAAVNTRYLMCRGTPTGRAVALVAVMQVAGAVADLLLLLAIVALTAGDDALGPLASRAMWAAGELPVLPLVVLGAALVAAAVVCGRRALRRGALAHAAAGSCDLMRRPRDLCLALVASAATTLVMAIALAVATLAVPGTGIEPGDLWVVVTAYMIGSAAGTVLPSPGGVGGTEAALVAALTAVGVAAGPAVQAVLLFRAITYWAPVPVGVLTARRGLTPQRNIGENRGDPVGEPIRRTMKEREPTRAA